MTYSLTGGVPALHSPLTANTTNSVGKVPLYSVSQGSLLMLNYSISGQQLQFKGTSAGVN
jgi:hypothetical protein